MLQTDWISFWGVGGYKDVVDQVPKTMLLLFSPDTSLSQYLKSNPAREEWCQRPLVINAELFSPADHITHSSTPLHTSKILPFADDLPLSLDFHSICFCPYLASEFKLNTVLV